MLQAKFASMSTYTCTILAPPDSELWIKPNIHPCKRQHADITDFDSDYVDLLNTVQRHTHCSTKYCLRFDPVKEDLQCRFKYQFDLCLNLCILKIKQHNSKQR